MDLSKTQSDKRINLLLYGLLFLFAFIYFLLFAPHVFYFQEQSSLFVSSIDFLRENLQEPGGLLVYLSTFLTSLGYYPQAGALITAGLLLGIAVLSALVIRRISGKTGGIFPILITLSIFFLQCDYQFLIINNLGLFLQLLLFVLIIKKPEGWLPAIIIPFWYYITGGFALVFAAMFIIWQLMTRPGNYIIRTSVFILISLITYYISSEYLFFQGTREMLSFPWSPGGTGHHASLFRVVTVVICLLPLIAVMNKSNLHLLKPLKNKFAFFVTKTLVLLILFCAIAIFNYDKKTLDYFRAEKLFVQERYQDLIDFNLKNPSNNKLTIFLNNIALCETGKLNDLLFHFHQSPDGGTLFLKWEIVEEIVRKGGYFHYCTGMINEANRWAYEYMVMKGITPEGLKMLIKTELINGNHKTAARYNNILRKTIFYRKDAERFDKLMFNDEAVNKDPELGFKRKIIVKRDFFSITNDPEIDIERIVATDSLNRKAFDYRIAWLLLSKNYQAIAGEWSSLGRYDFKSIPVHLEEAGIALRDFYNFKLPVTGNLVISKATEDRFKRFLQTYQSYGSSLQTAEPILRKQFGNTFWYYVFYK